jgi:Rieske 2Fe-2S family protein
MLDHGSPRPEDIATLLASRRAGHSLPAALYTSAAVWQADCDAIFGRHWIAVGVTCDVPEAGATGPVGGWQARLPLSPMDLRS